MSKLLRHSIGDLSSSFTGALPLLLADVTYGACCIDDFTAKEMGAEMIVHYGHSCLSNHFLSHYRRLILTPVPVSQTSIKTLYVFVEIAIDTPHLALSVRRNFPSSRRAFRRTVVEAETAPIGGKVDIVLDGDEQQQRDGIDAGEDPVTRLALVSTIQFVAAIQSLKTDLDKALPELETTLSDPSQEGMLAKMQKGDIGVWRGKYEITIPQSRPLSPGEILGCTAPKLSDVDALMYVSLFSYVQS